jgi:hypothetical protein
MDDAARELRELRPRKQIFFGRLCDDVASAVLIKLGSNLHCGFVETSYIYSLDWVRVGFVFVQ